VQLEQCHDLVEAAVEPDAVMDEPDAVLAVVAQ
jgi:hypothetical protein